MKFFCFLFFIPFTLFSQEAEKAEREKFPSFYAFQLRGLANNKFIESEIGMNNDTVNATLNMRNGVSIGALIRRQYTDQLSLEFGMNLNKRYFDTKAVLLDTTASYSSQFAFTNYEFPVSGLVFIKFSNKIFANAGLGGTFIFKPTSVLSTVIDAAADLKVGFEGYAYRKFGFNIQGQFGFEFRTEKAGIFYLGGQANIPTAPLFAFITSYEEILQGIRSDQVGLVRSPYFSLDIRYYLPKISNKGVQPIKGPIEQ